MSDTCTLLVAADAIVVGYGEASMTMPIGIDTVLADLESDPPRPEELTNAIGAVVDHLDDVLLTWPQVAEATGWAIAGPDAACLADIEVGAPAPSLHRIGRADAEDVFRTLATESSSQRLLNPGMQRGRVQSVLAAACIMVGVIRHLELDDIVLRAADDVDASAVGTQE